MTKVTRIAYSKDLNHGKYDQLVEMGQRLGMFRKEVWHRYGSVAGVGVSPKCCHQKAASSAPWQPSR